MIHHQCGTPLKNVVHNLRLLRHWLFCYGLPWQESWRREGEEDAGMLFGMRFLPCMIVWPFMAQWCVCVCVCFGFGMRWMFFEHR